MAIAHGAGTELDLYQAGTLRKRAYMCSIPIGKLESAVKNMLDDSEDDNDNKKLNKFSKYAWETYKQSSK